MNKFNKNFFSYFFTLGLVVFFSCSGSGENPSAPKQIVPSNLTVAIDIVGADNNNPNGDGTGVVSFTASANNAVTYGFKFGNEAEQKSTNGSINHTFTNQGTNTYSVTIIAYSSTNNSISILKSITVYVGSQPQEVIPSNLVVNANLVGADNSNPYGNGSGTVNFTASATNAISYGFIIDGQAEQSSTDGTYQYIFNAVEGVENHNVTVKAYSSTNNVISTNKTVAVSYYSGTPPFWADEFFENGLPSSSNWTYDLGDGGWGNGEAQTYTNSLDNVVVENGILKIIAKSNGSGGYTSARIKSQGRFEFTYGRVDVRAKLPASAGTWPAIWMLGANFDTVGWPKCGEIDIMEQTGSDKNKVLGTCHWFNTANASHASYGLDTMVPSATTQFHIYSMEWNASTIKLFVDNTQYYVIDITNSGIPNSPFHGNFFMILNVAMGGTLGGAIPNNFTQSTMEIDYIRVYQ